MKWTTFPNNCYQKRRAPEAETYFWGEYRHDTFHLQAFLREQNLNSYFFLNFYQLKTEGSPPFSFHIFRVRKRSSVFVVLLLLLLFSSWNIFSGFHKCVYIYSFLRSLFIAWGKSSEDLDCVTLKFTWRISSPVPPSPSSHLRLCSILMIPLQL